MEIFFDERWLLAPQSAGSRISDSSLSLNSTGLPFILLALRACAATAGIIVVEPDLRQ